MDGEKRVIGPLTLREPKRIAEIRAAIRPREHRVFQGVIRAHHWPFRSRTLLHAFGGRFGDHRDWSVIEAWADGSRLHSRACVRSRRQT